MVDESTFRARSWLNVLIIFVAVIRLRSASWMLEALGIVASMVAVLLIAIGLLAYWLIKKWSGR